MFKKIKSNWKLISVFLVAAVLRLILLTTAHHGDLNNNISWGTIAYNEGFNGFYEAYADTSSYIENWPYSAPNQPPLTIYLFTLSRFVFNNVKDFIWYMNWELLVFPSRLVWFWDEKGMDILVKLPSVLGDLGIGILIYKCFDQKLKSKQSLTGFVGKTQKLIKVGPLLIASIWLFNPAIIYNSSVWGQTDSIVNLLGFIGILALLEKKLTKFAIFFTLSLLFKPSLSIFVPVLLTVALLQKYPVKPWLKTALYSLVVVALISIPFRPNLDLYIWLYKLYTERFIPGEIGYLTANSFNFWWLVNPGWVYDNTVFFGLSARMWGFIITLSGILGTLYFLVKKISDKRIFFSLAFCALLSFLFMTRIHERYLYPFFPNATILTGLIPGFWIIYVLVSFIHLVNLYNFFWAPDLPWLKDMLLGGTLPNILSVLMIAVLPLMVLFNRNPKLKKI